MCGSGVTACHNVLAMEIAGFRFTALPRLVERVDHRSARPVATGE
jgi:thiosulfate/3-mercaptopyruvate sulfurtransferase